MPAKKATRTLPTSKVILTNSSLATWLTCNRRYKLQYEDGLRYKVMATPLIVGDIVHHGLACLMMGKPLDDVLVEIRGKISEARKLHLEDPEDFESDATIIEGMIRGWDKRRGLLKTATVWNWGDEPWVEKVFSWPMPNGDTITGKLDGVVEMDGEVWVVEHKTASRIDAAYISRLTVDAQVSIYYWAVGKIYGQKPAGVIYNVIRKPGIRQKKTESLAQFQDRLLEELTTQDGYFFQTKLYRDESMMTELEAALGYAADDIRKERQRGAWIKNPSQCVQIGRTCPMLPICSSGKKPEIMALYEKRTVLHPELV